MSIFNLKWLPLSAIVMSLVVPVVASAEFFSRTTKFIIGVKTLIDLLIPIVAGLALLYFFWGLAKFILHADNEDKREEGKQVMKWGIVALFVMVSIWGIVRFISDELLPGVSNDPIFFNYNPSKCQISPTAPGCQVGPIQRDGTF